MPVSVESAISGPYTPNGVTTEFPFAFKAISADDVAVVDQDGAAVSSALYSVSLDSDEGGSVIFSSAPSAADYDAIYIANDVALTQTSNFDNTGASFNPASLTRALDRAAARDLRQQAEIDRTLKTPFGETGFSLPPAALRVGGKLFGFNTFDGAPQLVSGADFRGEDAPPPQTVDFTTVAGQLSYPGSGDFTTVATRDGTVGFEYDSNVLVVLEGVVLVPGVDYTAAGGTAPIVLTADPGDGLTLSITSYASQAIGNGYRRYFVHAYRQTGEANMSAAVRRVRDAIDAAGGGEVYFAYGFGDEDDGVTYSFAEQTQNVDPDNEGNLCSDVTWTGDPGVWLRLDRTDGPFLFFHNPKGNQGSTLVEPAIHDVIFRGLNFKNDPTATGPGFEENSTFAHLSAVERVLFDRCRFIGSTGDGVTLAAGDLGPDDAGERQNRANRDIVFRDCYWDGVNKNNRNGVSIVSGLRVRFEGVNIFRNWGKKGGVGALDPYDPNTGFGAPAGGVDIEPNSFTANPEVGDISGALWVFDSDAAGVAVLVFNNDVAGIDLTVYAERCRLGLFAFQGNEHADTRPLIRISGIARDCPKPFEALRGGGMEVDAEFFDCPNPADLGYVEARRLSGFKLKSKFHRCGSTGAILRAIGGDGLDLDLTFLDPLGVPLQLTHDTADDPDTGEHYATVLSNSRIALKLDPLSTSFPAQRIAVDTSNGTPLIDAGSVFDVGDAPWTDAEGDTIPDAVLWQARGMFTRSAPDRYAWPSNAVVYADPSLEEGSPLSWVTVAANAADAYPAFQVKEWKGERPADPDITPIAVTKTAYVADDGNGRYTARRANQSVYATAAETVGSGVADKEWIYSVPYSGSNSIYAGVSRDATPAYDKGIADTATRFADVDAAVWFDGSTAKVRPMVNAAAGLYEAAPIALGGQVRILAQWNGSAVQVSFFARAGTSGSWGTAIAGPVNLTGSPTSLRAFLILGTASDTLQLVKQGAA